MIDSDVIRKISNLNNDNRDWQSLQEIETKLLKLPQKDIHVLKLVR